MAKRVEYEETSGYWDTMGGWPGGWYGFIEHYKNNGGWELVTWTSVRKGMGREGLFRRPKS